MRISLSCPAPLWRVLLSFLTFFAVSIAGAQALPQPVAQALAAAGIPQSAVGAYVQEIGAPRPSVSINAERPLNPASTMKLVTTYAALELLGPAYMWTTDVYAAAPLQGDVLQGDLFIKGAGDPKLTLENFWLMLRAIRARGLREIRGDVVLDRSFFALAEHDPGVFDEQPLRPYNTGPDALLVNFKAVAVQFMPDSETRRVRISVEPPLPGLEIVNRVSLSDGACGDWMARLAVEPQLAADTGRIVFSGSYARDCGERSRNFSVFSHRGYAGALFTLLWRELGGTFTGSVRDGTVASGAKLLTSVKSPGLSEVVRDINKYSNNVMARQLFLALGGSLQGAPATLDKSRSVIRQWLSQKALSFPELAIENGSGLSRSDRISAGSLATLLAAAFASPVMPEFAASLPLVATDGTMRKRLGHAVVAGHAHIKTGSLNDVRAIAGYVLDARGRRSVVVFIVNHPRAAAAQAAQDALLKWVYDR